MAHVYYIRADRSAHPGEDGEELGIEEVIERFRGHRKISLGLVPPSLRHGPAPALPEGQGYVLIEIGPEEIRPPDFLDIGFYLIR